MNNKQKNVATIVVVFMLIVAFAIGIGSLISKSIDKVREGANNIGGFGDNYGDYDIGYTKSEKSLEDLVAGVTYTTSPTHKGQVSFDEDLYEELPSIDKYPLTVEGRADLVLEIASSNEKAGVGTNGWLNDMAKKFNAEKYTVGNNVTVAVSVRDLTSGIGADYIISGKHLPDMWTPSSTLFADYAVVQGADLYLYNERLVGNTSGLLVKKDSGFTNVKGVVDAVCSGKLNLGYTNPQTAPSGLNLLLQLFKDFGGVGTDEAKEAFVKFNNNIPYIAFTSQQILASAAKGSLDAMVTEYQAYINDAQMVAEYNFIPYGVRHDNPMYVVNMGRMSEDQKEAVKLFNDFLMSEESQALATSYGYNANEDYVSSFTTDGNEIRDALSIYKKNKDAGREVVAVFVIDCSSSMDGEAMMKAKEALTNSIKYINEDNYIGLVSYDSKVRIDLKIDKFDLTQKSYFQGAVDNLVPSGLTHTYEALCVALNMLKQAEAEHPNAKMLIFLMSDGFANGEYTFSDVEYAVHETGIPIHTLGYGSSYDKDELDHLSGINEASSTYVDTDDIIYRIKSLFNSQL